MYAVYNNTEKLKMNSLIIFPNKIIKKLKTCL